MLRGEALTNLYNQLFSDEYFLLLLHNSSQIMHIFGTHNVGAVDDQDSCEAKSPTNTVSIAIMNYEL